MSLKAAWIHDHECTQDVHNVDVVVIVLWSVDGVICTILFNSADYDQNFITAYKILSLIIAMHNANRMPINEPAIIYIKSYLECISSAIHAHAWHPVHWTSRVSMIHSVHINVHTLGALVDSCSRLCGVPFLATENLPLSALSMTHCLADCS